MYKHITLIFYSLLAISLNPVLIYSSVDFENSATRFASSLAERMHELICEAAAIDPETLDEQKELKKKIISRQKQLNSWYREKGKEIRFEECKTTLDRCNYLEFRQVMANKEFLRLRYPKRLQFVSTINRYFHDFADGFTDSLKEMLCMEVWQTDWRPKDFTTNLKKRLQRNINLKVRYFNKNQFSLTSAIYVPDSSTIYLNLNSMIESPTEFIDAFEHELWHHLLPPDTSDKILEHLWWEGFTEAISKIWSTYINKSVTVGSSLEQSNSIQYPEQTAFASIYLGLNRYLTIAYLGGSITKKNFVSQLADTVMYDPAVCDTKIESRDSKPTIDFHPGFQANEKSISPFEIEHNKKLATFMANTFQISTVVEGKRREEIERQLRSLGWKEDNLQPIDISRYLSHGKPGKARLTTTLITEKQLLTDLIDIITMLNIQKLSKSGLNNTDLQKLNLPARLLANLNRVIRRSQTANSNDALLR